ANITVARPGSRWFAKAWPDREYEPSTSSLNFTRNSIRAANSFVRLGTDPQTGRRGFHVRVTSGARLYVDVSGYITGTNARFKTTDGQFVPVTPQRILDTRSSNTSLRGIGGGKRLWRGWSRAFGLPSSVRSSAGAVAVNLTMVRTMNPGWLTLLPARTARQEVSNVNSFFNGQVAANHAVTPVSSTGLEVYSSGGSSVVCDLVGYFLGRTVPETMPLLPDPPPQAVGPPYTLSIPRTGTRHSMVSGLSSVQVVDTGRIWHWTGTGMVGQGASIGAFGHRTDAGGPFRNIHFLRAGDRITIDTIDQRRYTYEYSGRELTSERDEEILAAAYREPGEMVSLIACTVGFDSSKSAFPDRWAPTSLRWRIVVRLRLVGWEDIAPLE
ncbi:MAG: sortase, partial [Actinomycetota bacterium]